MIDMQIQTLIQVARLAKGVLESLSAWDKNNPPKMRLVPTPDRLKAYVVGGGAYIESDIACTYVDDPGVPTVILVKNLLALKVHDPLARIQLLGDNGLKFSCGRAKGTFSGYGDDPADFQMPEFHGQTEEIHISERDVGRFTEYLFKPEEKVDISARIRINSSSAKVTATDRFRISDVALSLPYNGAPVEVHAPKGFLQQVARGEAVQLSFYTDSEGDVEAACISTYTSKVLYPIQGMGSFPDSDAAIEAEIENRLGSWVLPAQDIVNGMSTCSTMLGIASVADTDVIFDLTPTSYRLTVREGQEFTEWDGAVLGYESKSDEPEHKFTVSLKQVSELITLVSQNEQITISLLPGAVHIIAEGVDMFLPRLR